MLLVIVRRDASPTLYRQLEARFAGRGQIQSDRRRSVEAPAATRPRRGPPARPATERRRRLSFPEITMWERYGYRLVHIEEKGRASG